LRTRLQVKEREKWWDGADYMFGPRVGSDDYNEELADKNATAAAERARRTEEEQQKLVDRYSMDYSRWSDNTCVPMHRGLAQGGVVCF
jgi:hypothetical protein